MPDTGTANPQATNKEPSGNKITLPAISLPKGGGAIRGIGEKFAANPVTGTGSLTVPIATSPGRSGFGPQLSLSYDSGAGNGPFGLGWNLSLPSITRKTDKGLPLYEDAKDSDIFILSGAEDLVPVLTKTNGSWQPETLPPRTVNGTQYQIRRYKPRIEGLFARIERWTDALTGDVHWRSISKENITTCYGKTADSRIFDPKDPTHIFSWMICESYDDKGNAIVYEYVHEDSAGVDSSQVQERNRSEASRAVNRYLKRIKYGNVTSRLVQSDLSQMQWLFEIVFDYGEKHYNLLPQTPLDHQYVDVVNKVKGDDPSVVTAREWPIRKDPFSVYRAGYEVRTYRLCRRVLMFHHFPNELGAGDYLVRSTNLEYRETAVASFVTTATQSGYVHRPDQNHPNRYLMRSLPSLEFEYNEPPGEDELRKLEIKSLDEKSLENLPQGLDGSRYQWVDLDGEGISGILTEQSDAWFYKPNLGGTFGPLETVALKPSLAALNSGQQQLLDLAGDGQLDLVDFNRPTPGFYERTQEESWEQFTPFTSLPNIDWSDPNMKFVDLTGDGHADVLITENDVISWYASQAEAGFGPAEKVHQALDEEKGPRLVFTDASQSVYLADLSGDGLADLARIRNGEVCYWPNLGYGRFGAKVTMDNSPWFDSPDQFQQRRIRLADTDGSGTTDILYFGRDGLRIYLNQSGNSWSSEVTLTQFPSLDNVSSVQTIDLFGKGTSCLVWSSPLAGAVCGPIRYVELMEDKPHLLVGVRNNLGAVTQVDYVPSTKFYLNDKLAGKPWITRLPFPVHVVERVETYDDVSRNRFVTRYAYHHGYFDGVEREFRGFGMVEQWDTEEFATLTQSGALTGSTNLDAASHVPPVLTKTWFDTGAYVEGKTISRNCEHEYYREPALTDTQARALLLPDTVLPTGLTPEEEREACRALKGTMLRQETYALDGTVKAVHPYTVTEQDFTIETLQPKGDNRYAVFFTHAFEAITYHYERNPDDPRIQHAITIEVDDFGNVLKSANIGYGRRVSDGCLSGEEQKQQTKTLITYTENSVTNPIDTTADYRAPLPAETRTYELTGYPSTGLAGRFQSPDFTKPDPNDAQRRLHVFDSEVKYTEQSGSGRQRRLIEQVRTLYRKDDLTGFLNTGRLDSRAIPGDNYRLAFTPGLLAQVFQRNSQALLPVPADVLGAPGPDDGGYVNLDGDGRWWIPSVREYLSPTSNDSAAQELAYARQHFFVPVRYRDPFHTDTVSTETIVTYDAYDLLMQETRDALGNRVTAGERDSAGNLTTQGNDYRVLLPRMVMEPNRNRTQMAFDALGMVVATAVMGKPEETLGDLLTGFEPDLTEAVILDRLMNPLANPNAVLGLATTRLIYDVFAYQRTQDPSEHQPAVVYTIVRETHDADLQPGQQYKSQHSFSYSDGFGREIQKKIQAEPGPGPKRDANGDIIIGANGQPEMTPNDITPRWVGSGWTVFNNKGKPVRKYEPFFTDTHHFEFDVKIGVSPVLFYDPVERVVATLHPNHTWEKVVFDPWRQENWDVNDTTLVADPKNDAGVGDFFRRLPDAEYLPTWYAQRQGSALGAQEQDAAKKSAIHASTPTVAYADQLGRIFLTVVHNKFKFSDTPPANPPVEEFYRTRTAFDIEGNQREVIDAKGRSAARYDYDMLSNRIHQASMEAGERWTLNDVTGKPLYAWDSLNHRMRTAYDPLRRPTDSYLSEGALAEMVVARIMYGEIRPNPEAGNLRGKVVQLLDQAGIVTNDEYDFKGNLLSTSRQLAKIVESQGAQIAAYKSTVDWSGTVLLETDTYTRRSRFDALNRPIQLIAPHSDQAGAAVNVIEPIYNEANLLDQVNAWLNQSAEPTVWLDPTTADLHAVTNIDYDARGQRKIIGYGNGTSTTYEYDSKTSRLTNLVSTRASDTATLQDLRYTYDPAGNITQIRDDAQQTIYFRNKRVEPSVDYTYDATYRLIEALGREHLGQVGGTPIPHSYNDAPRVGIDWSANDGNVMGTYLERYIYDAVGNFSAMQHHGSDPANPGWTRTYSYIEGSLIESGKQSNRLSGTSIGAMTETYSTGGDGYDALGNMLRMPHLQVMQWDFKNQLQMTQRQAVNATDADGVQHQGERTWYVYDSTGQRVRKVTEFSTGAIKDERIYLGGFEIYRRNGANPLVRETLHVMDDKRRIALVETRTKGNEANNPQHLIRYEFNNHLGSASLELDDHAAIISYEEYTPYGSSTYQAVRSQTETPKRYRFAGKERDEENGLYYHGARNYTPWLARWFSCDPAGLVDGPNLYSFARNNPVLWTDSTGKQADKNETEAASVAPRGYGRQDIGDLQQETAKKVEEMGKEVESLNQLRGLIKQAREDEKTGASSPGNMESLKDQLASQKQRIDSLKSEISGNLEEMRKELSYYGDERIEDQVDHDRMVAAVSNYAILKAVFNAESNGGLPSKAEALESARHLVIDDFRNNREIKGNSVNTVYRDAEYYLVGRYMTHNIGGESTAEKEAVATGGAILSLVYNFCKAITGPFARTDKEFPNAPVGGSGWAYEGGGDAAQEKGEDVGLPKLLPVAPSVIEQRHGTDVPFMAPPFFPSRRTFMPNYN